MAQLGVNRFEVFAIAEAVYLRGLRSVALHALGSEADHAFIINDCGARIVVVDAYHRARGEALRPRCAQVGVWLSLGSIPGFAALEPALAAYRPQRCRRRVMPRLSSGWPTPGAPPAGPRA